MHMDNNKKPKVISNYTAERLDSDILLYTKAGTNAVYLNETAYAILQLCGEDKTVGQIIDYLEKIYPDQSNQIRIDVINALKLLESNNIIQWVDVVP